jgi:hypothetical protein
MIAESVAKNLSLALEIVPDCWRLANGNRQVCPCGGELAVKRYSLPQPIIRNHYFPRYPQWQS